MIRGINIDNLWDEGLEEKLEKITGEKRVARVVFSPGDLGHIEFCLDQVFMIHKYADLMIQIQDSYGERDLSDAELYAKAENLIDSFKGICSFWEVGNEVNGDWCSHNIAERVKTIKTLIPEGHKTALTLFWAPDPIGWYKENPIQTDYVFISYYPRDSVDISTTESRMLGYCKEILEINPSCQVGIGETDFDEWNGNPPSWRKRAVYRKAMEHPKINHPQWCGGGFWWSGLRDGFI